MTETKLNRTVRRGRIFPEIQWSAEKKAQWKAEMAATRQRCQVIFEKVKQDVIKTHYNYFMAIDPDSQDYFIDKNEEVATQMIRQKYPNVIPYIFVINETGVAGRIRSR